MAIFGEVKQSCQKDLYLYIRSRAHLQTLFCLFPKIFLRPGFSRLGKNIKKKKPTTEIEINDTQNHRDKV